LRATIAKSSSYKQQARNTRSLHKSKTSLRACIA
jgi:hypothetical protein